MYDNTDSLEQIILDITSELSGLSSSEDHQDQARTAELYLQLRLIGTTAAFCGGLDAMRRLYTTVERLAGKSYRAGHYINQAWHGVGEWWA